jgi:hypothetical protein
MKRIETWSPEGTGWTLHNEVSHPGGTNVATIVAKFLPEDTDAQVPHSLDVGSTYEVMFIVQPINAAEPTKFNLKTWLTHSDPQTNDLTLHDQPVSLDAGANTAFYEVVVTRKIQ